MAALPTTCPQCGSNDTGPKYQDDTCNECFACESFWYWPSPTSDKVEIVSGQARRIGNAAYEDAMNNECFGMDSGW